jgi:hypothetical protein
LFLGIISVKYLRVDPSIFLLAFLIAASPSYAQMECKCHSKQPPMRRMHETIGFTGCGNCHTKNENLMSKIRQKDSGTRANLSKRFREDRFCTPCHDPQGSVKKEVYLNLRSMGIAGTMYCPKDKLKYSSTARACSKCGGALLNIDELMTKSRQNPSNAVCIQCHMLEEVQKINEHALFGVEKLKGCLACHKGHNDCGSCHH